MLNKLRRRFVLTNMLLVALVLAVVFATVCVVNYNQKLGEVTNAVAHRVDDNPGGKQTVPSDTAQTLAADGQQSQDDSAAGATGNGGATSLRQSANDQFVATSTYLLNSDGSLSQTLDDSLSLDDDVRESATQTAIEAVGNSGSQSAQGHIDSLSLYYKAVATSGGYKVAFASDNYINQNMMSLVGTLAAVCAAALLAFLGISVFLARRALAPVESTWRQQQQFVADASHELKTPLTVIRANNSILMSQPDATVGDQMQWIQSTETEAECMQGLVNDMLYLARPEDEGQSSMMGTVDWSDAVDEAVLQFESVAFERGLTLDSDIEKGCTVQGDETRLRRLVATLVDNACKYAEEGGSVTVSLCRAGTKCVLGVANTGAAIDPDDLPHLFDRFYRADKARVRSQGGFGLGLSIAKTIAEEHGGTIAVESTPTVGTVFTVALPMA